MSDHSGIQWTDATWNPIRGCSRVSEGCRNCYAETAANSKRLSGPGKAYEGLTNGQGRWNGTIRVVDKHLTDPLRWRKPKRVFVNSMSDLFHENVSDETIDRIFAVMTISGWHDYQVLTKRAERMRAYLSDRDTPGRISAALPKLMAEAPDLVARAMNRTADINADVRERDGFVHPWPLPNVWLGVSVEDQATADARIPLLLQTPAAVRFISAEPLLGPLDVSPWVKGPFAALRGLYKPDWVPSLEWVIVGGESGRGARPCAEEWIANIVEQCQAAPVPVFVKQLDAYVVSEGRRDDEGRWAWRAGFTDRKGGDMAEWPEDLRVRQFPEVAHG